MPRQLKTFAISMSLGVCLLAFQNFTDPDTQNENLEHMQIEDEVLQTSTDDIEAQRKEALEQARLAEQERLQAEARLHKTMEIRQQVEGEAKVKISQNLTRRQRALETKNRLVSECEKIEREISIIEERMERAEREAKIAREEARRIREQHQQLKQRRAQLLGAERVRKHERRKTTGLRAMSRSVASYMNAVDTKKLPRTLPQKKR